MLLSAIMWTKFCEETDQLHSFLGPASFCVHCGAQNPNASVQNCHKDGTLRPVAINNSAACPILIEDDIPQHPIPMSTTPQIVCMAEQTCQKGFLGSRSLAKSRSMMTLGTSQTQQASSTSASLTADKYRTVVHIIRGYYRLADSPSDESLGRKYVKWIKLGKYCLLKFD